LISISATIVIVLRIKQMLQTRDDFLPFYSNREHVFVHRIIY